MRRLTAPALGMFIFHGVCVAIAEAAGAAAAHAFRPPAVPLATHSPYFSLWSMADRLTDQPTRHWTGKPQPIAGLIRIDGRAFRVIGDQPADVSALPQTSLRLTPTRSIYEFANDEIGLTLTFLSPLLPDDLEALARPVTYVIWEVRPSDGQSHEVSICLLAGGLLAVNTPDQRVAWDQVSIPGMAALRMGSEDQPILGRSGDDRRIDWGHAYVASPGAKAAAAAGAAESLLRAFVDGGRLPSSDDGPTPRAANDAAPAIAVAENLGTVSESATRFQMLAYDEIYSIQYFHTNLRPYWRRDGAEPAEALKAAAHDFAALRGRCEEFDRELIADAEELGGPRYAALCALAYRQALGACGLAADDRGAPLLFPKENHSNGCISTVDVIYPMAPQLLLLSPTLAKAVLIPPLDYAASPNWPYPYAPHDLGQYPRANGQVYGMGGGDAGRMPVEECGNLLILLAALAHVDGNADFAAPYWPMLLKWADYLAAEGFDPAKQLCTDDFAGHLARNANLAIKAILGVESMSRLCALRGDKEGEAKYARLAREGAAQWMELAADGDHYALAFGQPGTWSQKYNLVWDRILGFNVFPADVAQREAAFYRTKMNRYGLPLDSRANSQQPARDGMAKSDWMIWSATLGGSRRNLEALAGSLYDFYNETPDRTPMTDWFSTVTGRRIGFDARPVVGGVFLPFLGEAALWKKWSSRDKANPREHIWAPPPKKVEATITPVVPAADTEPASWRYTTDKPSEDWMKPAFDDSGWSEGTSGFGRPGTPGARIGTQWRTSDIWLRRTVSIPADAPTALQLFVHHDEDAEIYLNDVPAARLSGFTTKYELVEPASAKAAAALQPGAKIVLAAHCHNGRLGQYIDVGVVAVEYKE